MAEYNEIMLWKSIPQKYIVTNRHKVTINEQLVRFPRKDALKH